jgi:hypothetical protein
MEWDGYPDLFVVVAEKLILGYGEGWLSGTHGWR